MNLNKKTTLYIGVFVASVFVIAFTFLRPATINVIFSGSSPIAAAIPGVYRLADCAIITIAAFLLGVSMTILYKMYSKPSDHATTISLQNFEPLLETQKGCGNSSCDQIAEPIRENIPHENPALVLNLLKGNERSVMESLMNHGEMNQADLSARTGIPKSTLSRTLQNLEDRRLIFRYDNGMSKMVKPEIHWKGTGSNNHH